MTFRPFPADGATIRWATWDGAPAEELTLRWDNEAWTAAGRVAAHDVEYVLRVSPGWQVRQLLLFRDLEQPDLWLGTDGHGRWGEVNGAHRPELDGAFDVAVLGAAFPHTVPIRRLALAAGEAVELVVLHVDVETLAVTPVATTYAHLAGTRWRVAAAGHDAVELDVDDRGVPHDIAGHVRRVT